MNCDRLRLKLFYWFITFCLAKCWILLIYLSLKTPVLHFYRPSVRHMWVNGTSVILRYCYKISLLAGTSQSLFRNPLLNFIFPFTTSYFPRHFREIESLLARSRELQHRIKLFLPFLGHCTRLLAFQAVVCWPYFSNPGHKNGLP